MIVISNFDAIFTFQQLVLKFVCRFKIYVFTSVCCISRIRIAYYFISFTKMVEGSKKEKNNENFVLKSPKISKKKNIFAKIRGE